MTNTRKALEMAIAEIEGWIDHAYGHTPEECADNKAIQACKEALEQPTQEPMIVKQDNGMVLKLGYEDLPNGTAFYTTPPSHEWQSLSDDDISYTWAGFAPDAIDFARAIEAKLKEKNG